MNDTFWQLLLDLLVLLGAAGLLGVVAERLRQSAVVGYMTAGVLVGPNGFSVIENEVVVSAISQLGVALLMFSIGLEFSWSKLKRLGATALGSGTAQILGTTVAVAAIGLLFGLTFKTGVALGAIIALSSTAVVAPVLAKRAEIDSPHGRFCLGILLVQDAAVVPLVLLVTALGGEGTIREVMLGAGKSVLIVGGFVLTAWFAARFLLPWLQRAATATRNRDIVVLLAFAAAVGASIIAYRLDMSPALGAFIVAIFLGESPLATQVRADVAPLKTLFVTMFFGSIGMLADVAFVRDNPLLVFGTMGMVIVGKPLVMLPIGLMFRLPLRAAVAAALCMGQVGLFSFVLLQVGSQGKAPIIDDTLQSVMVSTIILTIFVTPYLVASGVPAGTWLELRLRRFGLVKAHTAQVNTETPQPSPNHVVIIGFGPAGRAVAEALADRGTPITLTDLNLNTVREARRNGMRAFVGDATQPETLDQLDLESAAAMVVTLPDHRLTMQVIRQARAKNPSLIIVARSRYSAYVSDLELAGAEVVIDEETTLGRRVGQALRDVLPPVEDEAEGTDAKADT